MFYPYCFLGGRTVTILLNYSIPWFYEAVQGSRVIYESCVFDRESSDKEGPCRRDRFHTGTNLHYHHPPTGESAPVGRSGVIRSWIWNGGDLGLSLGAPRLSVTSLCVP